MLLGIDVSSYLELKRISHPTYFKDGQVIDPFKLFIDNGVTHLRTRVWNDPYDENGNPYLGGTCDLDNFIKLAKELTSYKFKHILDFHYSDFWVDPGKQFIPKAWKNLTYEELVKAVYDFTKESLQKIKKEGIDLDYIQTGNEITHGMLWPFGKLDVPDRDKAFDRFASLLNSAIKACHEVYPDAKIIIHFEQSYDKPLYRDIISNLLKRNVRIDVIGTSYYPFWHHDFNEYFDNMRMVQKEFGLPTMNVEVGYPFTLLDYVEEANNNPTKHMIINTDNVKDFKKYMPSPASKEGQAYFIKEFIRLSKENNMLGVCYWEPMLIPKGAYWASKEGQLYQNLTPKEERSDWANMSLFDYEGNLLPGFEEYKL